MPGFVCFGACKVWHWGSETPQEVRLARAGVKSRCLSHLLLPEPHHVPSPRHTCNAQGPLSTAALSPGATCLPSSLWMRPGSSLRPLLCGCLGLWVSARGHLPTWEQWLPIRAGRAHGARIANHRLASCCSRKRLVIKAPFTQSWCLSRMGQCRGCGDTLRQALHLWLELASRKDVLLDHLLLLYFLISLNN